MNLEEIDAEIKRLQDLKYANFEQAIIEVFQKETPEFYFAYEGSEIVLTYKLDFEFHISDINLLKRLYKSAIGIEVYSITSAYRNHQNYSEINVYISLNPETIPLLAQLELSPTDMKFFCHNIIRSLREQINEKLEHIEANKKTIEECKIRIENLTKLREAFSAN